MASAYFPYDENMPVATETQNFMLFQNPGQQTCINSFRVFNLDSNGHRHPDQLPKRHKGIQSFEMLPLSLHRATNPV